MIRLRMISRESLVLAESKNLEILGKFRNVCERLNLMSFQESDIKQLISTDTSM